MTLGASGFQILTNVIIPLTKPGIMIGSIFVVALVMSDFVTTRFMSGSQLGQRRAPDLERRGLLQYPSAAATSVILLHHRPSDHRRDAADRRHPEGALGWSPPPVLLPVLGSLLRLFMLFLYGPTITIAILSFQGPEGGLTFPLRGVSLTWFRELFMEQAVGDIWGSFRRSLVLGLMVMVDHRRRLGHGRGWRSGGISRVHGSFLLVVGSLVIPSILVSMGIGLLFRPHGLSATIGRARPLARS